MTSFSDTTKSARFDVHEVDSEGRLTNGQIMLELLGDEPDVSHTSLALARELGLPDNVLQRLGAGRAAGAQANKSNRPPLQNRVDPYGRLNAVATKGSLMGNRGILHNASKEIVRNWTRHAWVTCALQYKDIRRPEIFGSGSYSELFFLDEATAFSAGHRPCAYCRKDRFDEFKRVWIAANRKGTPSQKTSIREIDSALHQERAARGGTKVSFEATLQALPQGTFVDLHGRAFLLWNGTLRAWSFGGYDEALPMTSGPPKVVVLTPASIVRSFAAGLIPQVHPSANT